MLIFFFIKDPFLTRKRYQTFTYNKGANLSALFFVGILRFSCNKLAKSVLFTVSLQSFM
jgi:hypothetical protein